MKWDESNWKICKISKEELLIYNLKSIKGITMELCRDFVLSSYVWCWMVPGYVILRKVKRLSLYYIYRLWLKRGNVLFFSIEDLLFWMCFMVIDCD